MVREYIGARYVTKIYENSGDPSLAEWEAGVTYEPLTLVTYNNSSYLSKKEVPGSVGDPAANPTYWVVTGAYNGQIATLQSQINAIVASIGDLSDLTTPDITSIVNAINSSKRGNVLIIGDSYSRPSFVPAGKEWFSLLQNDGYKIYNYSVGGSGFVQHQTGSVYIDDEIDNALGGVDPDIIDYVILYAGLNDFNLGVTPAQIYPAALAAIQKIKTNFTNAIVLYVPFDYGYANVPTYSQLDFLNAMVQAGTDEEVLTFKDSIYMFGHGPLRNFIEGSGHPNEAGNEVIYNVMKRMIGGNNEPIEYCFKYAVSTDNNVTMLRYIVSYITVRGMMLTFKAKAMVDAGTYNNGDSYKMAHITSQTADVPLSIGSSRAVPFDAFGIGFDLATLHCKVTIDTTTGDLVGTFDDDKTFGGTFWTTFTYSEPMIKLH